MKFKPFRIKLKKSPSKNKVRKISKAALMSVSQSSSSSEDQSILASLRPNSSMLSTRRRLQCTLIMFLTVAQSQSVAHRPAAAIIVDCDYFQLSLFTPYS